MHCVISWSCDLFYTLNDTYRKQGMGEHRKCTTRTCLRWTHTSTQRTWAGTMWTALFKVVLKLFCAFQSWEALPHTRFIFLELWPLMQCYVNIVQFCNSLHTCNISPLLELLWSTTSLIPMLVCENETHTDAGSEREPRSNVPSLPCPCHCLQ